VPATGGDRTGPGRRAPVALQNTSAHKGHVGILLMRALLLAICATKSSGMLQTSFPSRPSCGPSLRQHAVCSCSARLSANPPRVRGKPMKYRSSVRSDAEGRHPCCRSLRIVPIAAEGRLTHPRPNG
jgi:hypothetical protein